MKADETRHEVKMVAPREAEGEVRMWVNLHPAGFHEAYPRRRVNNIYLDTVDLDSYGENLSGIARRVKIRLRWYGEIRTITGGTVELKCKQAGPGWKVSHRTSVEIDLREEDWPSILEKIRKDCPPRFLRVLDVAQRPVLINSYERDYLVSNDGRVRITLDRPQSVFSQWATTRPDITIDGSRRDVMIIEAKVANRDRDRLAEVLADFPLTVGRHSKYVTGVHASIF